MSGGVASLVAFSTVRGLDKMGRQVEGMSAVDLRPIELSETVPYPREVRSLIGNFNNLLDRTARMRLAEFDAISHLADTVFIVRPDGTIGLGVYGQVSYTNGYGLYTPNRLYVGQAANIVGTLTAGVLTANSFAGSGSNLTNLNAASITAGTLADARLSANVPLLNVSQTFTGTNAFNPPAGPPFTVASNKRVPNLNADLLDGLDSTEFLRSDLSSTQTVGQLTFASGTRLLVDAGTADAVPKDGADLHVVERTTGFEPATPTLARLCSTN